MEKLIEDLELTNSAKQYAAEFGNYINQPEKVQISSNDGLDTAVSQDNNVEEEFSSFTVRLPRPINGAKKCQINRIALPTPTTNIPDHDCVFWFYRLPKDPVYNRPVDINAAYLHCVRLLPSFYHKEIMPTAYGPYCGYNRTFTDYQDLANELAKSCQYDTPFNPYFLSYDNGGIMISYDAELNKFYYTGKTTDGSYYYLAAGYSDTNIMTAEPSPNQNIPAPTQKAGEILQGDTEDDTGLAWQQGQPYKKYRTLNLRLGWTWDGRNLNFTSSYAGANVALVNRVRPLPVYWLADGLLAATPNRATTRCNANSYACLVYTNVVNVYCDFLGPGTLDSTKNINLLASIPMATNNLGVAFYQASMDNIITKIPSDIYTMTFYFKDDIGDDYPFSNQAVVSLEINFGY
jgi:hypothetical protein